jgi:hypothetical protein
MQNLWIAAVLVGTAVVGSNLPSPDGRLGASILPSQALGPSSLCVANRMVGKIAKITIRGDRIGGGAGGTGLIVPQGDTSCYTSARYGQGYSIMVGDHPVPYNFTINIKATSPYVSIGFPGFRNADVAVSPAGCTALSASQQTTCTVTFRNLARGK